MLTTHVERFSDCFEEMKALNVIHYHEISEHYKHGVPLNPDYPKYFAKEANGELLYVTLRDCGQLIGYYIGFIGPALHYQDCLQAALDIIYVEPNSRGQKGGRMLGEMVKAEHCRRGVRLMTMGYKKAHEKYMRELLIDLGMHEFEVHYALWFD